MITTENPVPTRPLLLSVRNSTPARPSPSTHPTHSITNLLPKRTVTAKIISHQARHNTTTTIIHQPPPKPPTSYSLRHDLHLLDRPLTQPGGNPSLFYFISGSSTAAQNNYLLRIGKGKGRKGAGQAGTGREGKEGRGHVWTDRLLGWSGKSGFLSFSLLSPDYFVGLFLFFNQFKNLFAFLLDLICATIQRCFFFGEASERASFLRFSFIFAFTCYSLLLLLLLLLLLFFDLDLFLLLSFFLGCHLSVCRDHYCTGALPSRGKEEGDVLLTSASMYSGWRGGV